jgi:hypothetical protein
VALKDVALALVCRKGKETEADSVGSAGCCDIRSRANTTRGLNFDHKIKARAHKRDMRMGKTTKKLASICCPQRRETKADTLKATEANRKRGSGTREKVRSKRINLEVTHMHRKLM